MLMAVTPRFKDGPLQQQGEPTLSTAVRVAVNLDHSVFPVQGPPGAGKTYIGARMIRALAKQGKNVGVTANSHKVIRNLLDEVVSASAEEGPRIRCIQKLSEKEDDLPGLRFTTNNAAFLGALGTDCRVGGATAWFWSRPDASRSVDVLVIDEAAQMSLANVLAASQAADSIVLLGDPRQLEQPIGSDPDGVEVSALNHILGPHATVPPDRGLFLGETWRLHPRICVFNSELFYEGRLHSRPGLENQEIRLNSLLKNPHRHGGDLMIYFIISNRRRRSCAAGLRIRAACFRTSRRISVCQRTIHCGRSGNLSGMF